MGKLRTMVRKNGDNGPFMHSLHWLPKNKFWQAIKFDVFQVEFVLVAAF